MRFSALRCVFQYLPWLSKTNVSSGKTQRNAENTSLNWTCKCAFKQVSVDCNFFALELLQKSFDFYRASEIGTRCETKISPAAHPAERPNPKSGIMWWGRDRWWAPTHDSAVWHGRKWNLKGNQSYFCWTYHTNNSGSDFWSQSYNRNLVLKQKFSLKKV